MWLASITPFLAVINVCLAANPSTPNSFELSPENVDKLVGMFASYRDDEILHDFATAVGDMSLLHKKRDSCDGRNFVKLYLYDKQQHFFDALRKTYLYCNKKGNEQLMGQLKRFLQSCDVKSWEILFHALPFISDFKEEEVGLLNMLKDIWYFKRAEQCRLWESILFIDPTTSLHGKKGTREERKYYLAMLRHELVSAPVEIRGDLIKKAKTCLGLHELSDLDRFLVKRFGDEYPLGDIHAHVLGPIRISLEDQIKLLAALVNPPAQPQQPGPFNHLHFDIWTGIISRLDWRTLMYSMPYVNKAMHKYITESRKHLECTDLKSFLGEQAKTNSPEALYIFEKPWGTICPTFSIFLTFYFLNNDPTPWKEMLFGYLCSHGFSYHLLLSKFMHHTNGQHPSGISMNDLALIFQSVLASSKTLNPLDGIPPFLIPSQLIVQLMGKADDCSRLTQFFEATPAEFYERSFFEAILRPDELDWPEDLKLVVEKKFAKKFKVSIALPFTAEQIQKFAPEQLQILIKAIEDPLLQIKIFNALLETDCESKTILTVERCNLILNRGLASNPTAMTAKQFDRFIKWAVEMYGGQVEFQECLSEFMSRIRGRNE